MKINFIKLALRQKLLIIFISKLFFVLIKTQETNNFELKKSVPCNQLPNGNYVWGCSHYYSTCANKYEYHFICYNGLILNPDNNQCDNPKNVWLCQNSQTDLLYRSKDPFSCENQEDGNYEADSCSGHYYQCYGGNRFERDCPFSLIYNPKSNNCDFLSNCEYINPQHVEPINLNTINNLFLNTQRSDFKESLPNVNSQTLDQDTVIVLDDKTNQTIEFFSDLQTYNNQSSLITEAPKKIIFDCLNKLDGDYLNDINECTDTFWKCSNSLTFEYECPKGLFYDIKTNRCDYSEFIIACGGQPLTTTISTTTTATNISTEFTFNCVGKANGLYELKPCYYIFYSCLSEISTALTCSAGTVYDRTTTACEYPHNCNKNLSNNNTVNAYNESTTVAPTLQPIYVSSTINAPVVLSLATKNSTIKLIHPTTVEQTNQSSIVNNNQSTKSKLIFSCINKADGYYYKKKCSSTFIICSKEQLSQQQCPDNLLFDPALAACQYSELCGKTELTTTAATEILIDVEILPILNFDCNGKNDGYYVQQPCTSKFFYCASSNLIHYSCPPTLVFNPFTLSCEYPNICDNKKSLITIEPPIVLRNEPQDYQQKGDVQPQKSVNKNPSIQESLQPYTQKIDIATAAPVKLNFECIGRPDGYYYLQPCISTYYTCVSNQTELIQCQNSFVFDPESVSCKYSFECGKMKPTATITPPVSNSVAVTIIPVINPKQIKKEFSCVGRSDGYYVKSNCISSFYTCNNGIAIKTICPNGLVLDISTGTCEYPDTCKILTTKKLAANSEESKVIYVKPIQVVVNPVSTTTTISAPITCGKIPIGIFPFNSCSSKYVICLNGYLAQGSCFGSFIYNPENGLCDYKQNVKECNNQQVPIVL